MAVAGLEREAGTVAVAEEDTVEETNANGFTVPEAVAVDVEENDGVEVVVAD